MKGVYIAEVIENGSADVAGIKKGSVILKIGNRDVNSVASVQEEVGKRRPGDKLAVTIKNPSASSPRSNGVLPIAAIKIGCPSAR